MIVNDFYPTDRTVAHMQLTKTWFALTNIVQNDFASPYYMGYIEWDNFPEYFHLHALTPNSENGTFSFRDITQPSNISWGFYGDYVSTSNELPLTPPIIMRNDGDSITLSRHPGPIGVRFINGCSIANYNASPGIVSINVVYADFIFGGETGTSTTATGYIEESTNLKKFYDFLVNGADLTITIDNAEYTINVSAYNPETKTFDYPIDNGVRKFAFTLFNYRPRFSRKDDATGGDGYPAFNAFVSEKNKIDDKIYTFPINGFGATNGSTFISLRLGINKNDAIVYPYDIMNTKGFDDAMTAVHSTDYENAVIYGKQGSFMYKDAVFIYNGYISEYSVYAYIPNIPIEAMLYSFMFVNKVAINQGSSLTPSIYNSYNSEYYAPQYTNTNVPTLNYLNGSLSEIATLLQTWQLPDVDITTNEYKDSDKPEYTPGGGGDVDENDSGNIPLSVISVQGSTGFVTSYGIGAGTLNTIGNNLWKGLRESTQNFIRNFFSAENGDYSYSDILSFFVSLMYFPIKWGSISNNFTLSTRNGIDVGSGALGISTGLINPYIVNNYVCAFDGGTVYIPRTYNNYQDFEPYTSITAYVPFCGTVKLSPSVVMGATLSLKYAVDLLTGACTAVIMKDGNVSFPVAYLNGTVGFDMPITGNNAKSKSAQLGASFIHSIAGLSSGIVGSLVTGNPAGAISGITGAVSDSVNNMSLSPLSAGSSDSMDSLIKPAYFYITVHRHNPDIAQNYDSSVGYLYNKSDKLRNLSGFTICENVDTTTLTATEDERNEIKRLLESGVYL